MLFWRMPLPPLLEFKAFSIFVDNFHEKIYAGPILMLSAAHLFVKWESLLEANRSSVESVWNLTIPAPVRWHFNQVVVACIPHGKEAAVAAFHHRLALPVGLARPSLAGSKIATREASRAG